MYQNEAFASAAAAAPENSSTKLLPCRPTRVPSNKKFYFTALVCTMARCGIEESDPASERMG
jgi:hypothetical protein